MAQQDEQPQDPGQQERDILERFRENQQVRQQTSQTPIGRCYSCMLLLTTYCPIIFFIIALSLQFNSPCSVPLQMFIIFSFVPANFVQLLYGILKVNVNRRLEAGIVDEVTLSRLRLFPVFDRLNGIVSFFEFAWCIAGTYWIAHAGSCPTTAPLIYWAAVVRISVFYFNFASVFLLCCFYCCFVCCPENAWWWWWFGVEFDPETMMVSQVVNNPTPDHVLASLPVRVYEKKSDEVSPLIPRRSSGTPQTPTAQPDGAAFVRRMSSGGTFFESLVASASQTAAVAAQAEDVEEDMCAICYENFEDGDRVLSLPCQHEFHEQCVKTWLLKSQQCPLCRHNVTMPNV